MTTRKPVRVRQARRLPVRPQLDHPMMRMDRRRSTVSFQWQDGAGELHFTELSHAQSWPYLHEQERQ